MSPRHAADAAAVGAAPITMDELQALVPNLGSDDLGVRKTAQQTFQQACWRAGAPLLEHDRMALCRGVCRALQLPDLNPESRVFLARQLGHIGQSESVGTLELLLGADDVLVRDAALAALQRIPASDAGEALRQTLARETGPVAQAALLNALVYRHERDNLRVFRTFAESPVWETRMAAARGLADLGDEEVLGMLRVAMASDSPRDVSAATDVALTLADRLRESGREPAALALYRELLERDGQARCAAVLGVGETGGEPEIPILFAAIEDSDPEVCGAARSALAMLPAEIVTPAILQRLDSAGEQMTVSLLDALADSRNPGTVGVFISASQHQSEAVATAACRGIGEVGDPAGIPALVAVIASAETAPGTAAADALARFPGDHVVEVLLEAVSRAETEGQMAIVSALGSRRSERSAEALLELAESASEAEVRIAAVNALAKQARETHVAPLLRLLVASRSKRESDALRNALVAASRQAEDTDVCAATVARELEGGSPETQAVLLRTLGRMGGNTSLETVRAALPSSDPDVREAAVRALADWPDLGAVADLLAVAKDSELRLHRTLALRGYVRLVEQATECPPAERLAMLRTGMAVAPGVDEKKLVLGALGAIHTTEALDMASGFLPDPDLAADAAAVTVALAEALQWSHSQAAETALKTVQTTASLDATKHAADELLEAMRKYRGYMTTWLFAGPFSQKGKAVEALFDMAFGPEVETQDGPLDWKLVRTSDKPAESWFVPLDQIFGDTNCVGYMRTYIRSAEARNVLLEIGSDDGLKAWLNGQQLMSSNTHRAIAPAQEAVQTSLQTGWNVLQMKITQGGGQWSGAARFVSAEGEQIPELCCFGSTQALEAALVDVLSESRSAVAVAALDGMTLMATLPPSDVKRALRVLATVLEDPERKKAVEDRLTKIEATEDHITDWLVAGPYSEAGKSGPELFDSVLPPEEADGANVSWQTLSDTPGAVKGHMIDLIALFGGTDRAAYLRTRVTSPTRQSVRLDIGSDDGVKVWLNGTLVHANNASRPVVAGEDKAVAELREGPNELLLKVVQGSGGWGASLRIRTPEGEHIEGLEVSIRR